MNLAELRIFLAPYVSFGIVTLVIAFSFELLLIVVTKVLRDRLNHFFHRYTPTIIKKFQHIDYFICFLITVFMVSPVAKLFLEEFFEPFLLTAHLIPIISFILFSVFFIYLLFEKKYKQFFRPRY